MGWSPGDLARPVPPWPGATPPPGTGQTGRGSQEAGGAQSSLTQLLPILWAPCTPVSVWGGRTPGLGRRFPTKEPQALGPAQSLPEARRPHWGLILALLTP